ncbi:OmpA family protein [Pseudooceanicola sp. LIPI14-2-Ac024]|uniref:OmpA family protein n=1 Tax=Pseudooceanicola sp. LIPI14-2-Ac024 TaxID=3344875 RepID=UPI0035CEAB2E
MTAFPKLLAAGLALALATGPVLAQETATEEGLKVYFDSGTARLKEDQTASLDQAARLFREGSPIVMILSGSADTVGSAAKNLDLSVRRAQAVADGLVDRGIPVERLQVLGRGNSELVVPTENGVENAENRSVTITWR